MPGPRFRRGDGRGGPMPPTQLQLIRLSDHHGVIRNGTGRLEVSAPGAMGVVERVVEGLNRGDSREVIMSGVPGPSRPGVASLLAGLAAPSDPEAELASGPAGRTVIAGRDPIAAAAVRSLVDLGVTDLIDVPGSTAPDATAGRAWERWSGPASGSEPEQEPVLEPV